MSPEEWKEIDTLVQAAFERGPDERAAFLAEACAGKPEVRREVVALIEADSVAQSFLETPVLGPGPKPQVGELFGAYELLEEIGYGGFCRVYRARHADQDFERQVAVKVVDPGLDYGFGDDTGGDIAERFRRERQILAQLEHASIARLFDGGELGGRPFFVMELIDGEPIDLHCRRRRLGVNARLRLMMRVADAVAYAHERLIVHRDLKPANLLVTRDGEPKLLDFGIAKVLEPEALAINFDTTRSGLRPMTPSWAAPEQVRGETVTTATDVYGLGLLLYFLLTGERAYDFGDMTPSQMETAICDIEPAPPSRRLGSPSKDRPADATSSRLEGDLDAIVMTALAKDPKRRYRSVRELARDLERFLGDQPVTARPATRLYRTGKWLRRHRWAALSAALAAVVLAAFTTTLFLQSKRLAAERDLARQESSRAEEVSRFLVEIFAEADPGRTQGRDLSVRRILAEGRSKIDRLDEPMARTELLATLGSVHAGLGEVQEGSELLRRARLEAQQLYGEEHERVAEIDHRLGEVLLSRDIFPEAEASIRSAIEIRRRLLGDSHFETNTSLALLGRLRSYLGFSNEAEDILSRAVERLEASGPEGEPAMIEFLGDLATARQHVGLEGYEPLLQRRLGLAKEKLGEHHPLVIDTLVRLAYAKADPAARLAELESMQPLMDEVFTSDHPEHALLYRTLSVLYLSHDPQRALELAQRSMEIDLRVWGEGTWTLSIDHAAVAAAYFALGEIERADEHWLRAVEDARRGAPMTHSWRGQIVLNRLAFVLNLEDDSRSEEARRLIEELETVRAGLPHRSLAIEVVSPALEALLDLRTGDQDAAERLRLHGPKALELVGNRKLYGPLLRQALAEVGSPEGLKAQDPGADA